MFEAVASFNSWKLAVDSFNSWKLAIDDIDEISIDTSVTTSPPEGGGHLKKNFFLQFFNHPSP